MAPWCSIVHCAVVAWWGLHHCRLGWTRTQTRHPWTQTQAVSPAGGGAGETRAKVSPTPPRGRDWGRRGRRR
eukprot:7928409-Lingulodinium_polyedra.AAC.1